MDNSISQNAGKVLLKIYLNWKENNEVPLFNYLEKNTNLEKNELKSALKYCYEKNFINLKLYSIY